MCVINSSIRVTNFAPVKRKNIFSLFIIIIFCVVGVYLANQNNLHVYVFISRFLGFIIFTCPFFYLAATSMKWIEAKMKASIPFFFFM